MNHEAERAGAGANAGRFTELAPEFVGNAAEWTDPVTRRHFLTLMGASVALAGAGCSPSPVPHGRIMPYVRQPEGLTPGKPLFYATAMPLSGYATGVLVESHEGRPTKIEGNPDHPASRGGTDLLTQASILGLYDPDRSQAVTYRGRIRTWNEALGAIRAALEKQRPAGGAGVCILTEPVGSPTLVRQLEELLRQFPGAKWHQYDPVATHHAHAGTELAFGEGLSPIYHFDRADVIVALDADFLWAGSAHIRHCHDFGQRRRAPSGELPTDKFRPNRLYVAESMLTVTGSVADQRLRVRSGDIDRLARALAAQLQVPEAKAADLGDERQRKWVASVTADLLAHKGTGVVVPGNAQSPAVHALAHAINHHLGNVGTTVEYIPPVHARPTDPVASLRELVEDLKAKKIEVLLILGGNPAFAAPADLEFSKYLVGVPLRVHLGQYQDETAAQCHWHINETHYLEEWGDARAFDGAASVLQPLIAPLYEGKSCLEFVMALANRGDTALEEVRATWRDHWQKSGASGDFETFWRTAVHNGVVPGTAAEVKNVAPKSGWAAALPAAPAPFGPDELEIVFRPDPTVHDGRFANNGWLQELPKPITKLTWDNAVFLSPATAAQLGVARPKSGPNGGERGEAIVDLVEVELDGRKLTAPAFVLRGHADHTITVHFGYGRDRAGKVGNGAGFNAFTLRTTAAHESGRGLKVRKAAGTTTLAAMQMHHNMEGRDLVQAFTAQAVKEGQAARHEEGNPEARVDSRLIPLTLYPGLEPGQDSNNELYPEQQHPDPRQMHRWAMCIDQTACIGCQTCVIACQAENNSPVVGKTEVTRGREMHWLRVDKYHVGDENDPTTYHQPVPCMQCENAPCEVVCPVGATVHSHDGLNDMVYNRCVGTRYCSNNCPYKVRRFNFFFYADYATESLKLQRNPEVTVRSRGVMEKCTYCVQRIRNADVVAEREGRPIRDGEIVTACQAACPTGAIMFGDLNDPQSRVNRWKASKLDYGLLEELNTRPRTTYLAAIRNPNPETA